MEIEAKLKLKIRESELILSLEEAKKLYKMLSELFTENNYQPKSIPPPPAYEPKPWNPNYNPYEPKPWNPNDVWCGPYYSLELNKGDDNE